MYAPSKDMRKSLAARLSRYREAMPGSPAEEYLRGRGITKETADYFQLGFVADPVVGDERYHHRLVIPYLTSSGVVQLRFRRMGDGGAKYMGDPGIKGRPFNTLALKSTDRTVYITEGEIDAMTLHQLGLPAVGIPGADLWNKLFARIFRWRRVVILIDGDTDVVRDNKTAGQLFGESVGRDLDEYLVISMPDGEDVNSVFCTEGAEGLRKRIGA